ncbi:MAG: ABC transporter ATP-binding protein [Clostridiales bacterium]|nr:ABC transporter ATP-binding protein [Clostridiales bacterium]
MIILDNVSLRIKKVQILEDISLELEDGQIHGLVGRNGCGKTMLMKCICGFVRPTGGRIQVNGKYVGEETDFPEHLGVMIETPGFISYLSGYENLRILAGCRKMIGKEEIRDAMKQVELDPDSRLHVKKYSMGMRQRLGIAQAIMEHPRLLVLDEPFNGLDEDAVRMVRNLLDEKREQGVTIVLSSHNAEDIRLLCDSVHRLSKGRLCTPDPPG